MTAPLLAAQLHAASPTGPAQSAPALPASAVLAAGTPVDVALDQDLTTVTNKTGDVFQVSVARDVVDNNTVVIPKGAIGHGAIIWLGKRGDFGKAGLISFSMRDLQLGDRKIPLEGTFRVEGKSKGDETAATWFMIGVFSGVIHGKDIVIPKGRELRVRTRLAIAYVQGAAPPSVALPASSPASLVASMPADHSQVIASTNIAGSSQPTPGPARPVELEGKDK